jgi:hypothetical protein
MEVEEEEAGREGGNLMRASQFWIVGMKVTLELLHFQPTI